jgi:drug/metabolite transporter (DMT)-like permease
MAESETNGPLGGAKTLAIVLPSGLAGLGIAAVLAVTTMTCRSTAVTVSVFAFAISIPFLSGFALAYVTRTQKQISRPPWSRALAALGVLGLLAWAIGLAALFFSLSTAAAVTFLLAVMLSGVVYLLLR